MSMTNTPTRRALLLGGAGAAALSAGVPSLAFADSDGPGHKGYGAPPSDRAPRNVHGDGGPRPRGGQDEHGMPLPEDPNALPNSTGVSGGREQVHPANGRRPVSFRSGPGATRLAASSVPNYHATAFPTLGPGAGLWDVRGLQYLLLAAGHKTNWEQSYGASTTAAVKAYQKEFGLSATGTADPKTIEALCGAKSTGRGAVSYKVYAIQALLRKHNYRFYDADAPEMSTNYGPVTEKYVRAFQVGHGMGPAAFVGYYTWRTLFAAKTSEAMYALLQYQTGNAQWANCGPTSAVTLLIHRGLTPRSWGWNTALRRPAVEHFRYTAMGVARTAERDKRGTEFPDFDPAFKSYGITPTHGGINDTIAKAKQGVGSIAGGDANTLPWENYVSGPVSHWVAVLGWDGTYFPVMDPISRTTNDVIHRLTETQLRKYASTNPGHPPETAKRNSIILP